MKKITLFAAALLAFGAATFTACKDDDDNDEKTATIDDSEAVKVEYNSDYAKQWGNYMRVVATLLKTDSDNLYKYWNEAYDGGDSYAKRFKGAKDAGFTSAKDCVEQIVDGCIDIANEVGTAKINDPVELWKAGNTDDAVLAVESWFSWHSRDDFANNIGSIKNAYFGSLDGSVNANSISKMIASKDAALDIEVSAAIATAQSSILAIPQPFRNSLGSPEAQTAIEQCVALRDLLKNKVKAIIDGELKDADWQPVLDQYVDNVVLPTYKDLSEKNTALYNAVVAFEKNPSNDAFQKCADAWLNARKPWESSEAFLFGPVADKGLDPNMDSWPLDLSGIVNVFNTSAWADLEWSGDYEEIPEGEEGTKHAQEIESAQSLRGFHTLEYLIFKDGKARTIH